MNVMREIEKLIKYFKQFQLTDILAFGNILQVEEIDPFEDYITNICEAFSKQNKTKRRQLLKLAKDVAGANKDYDNSSLAAAPRNATIGTAPIENLEDGGTTGN